MAERMLSPDEQVLAGATKMAVQAAGGLDVCARETGISTSQLSRCCNPQSRDSITLRDALTIQQIGYGTSGHPAVLRAMARLLGFVVVKLPHCLDDKAGVAECMMQLTRELGDVAGEISAALADDGEVDAREARAILQQMDEMDEVSATLRLLLTRIGHGKVRK
jgi:hypothetical protein